LQSTNKSSMISMCLSINYRTLSKSFCRNGSVIFLCNIKNSPAMKKLFNNTNPFILLLAPVVFALIMGISYQFEQKKQNSETTASVHPTSLFFKGVSLIRTICSVSKNDAW
jgi:hypothetical protein